MFSDLAVCWRRTIGDFGNSYNKNIFRLKESVKAPHMIKKEKHSREQQGQKGSFIWQTAANLLFCCSAYSSAQSICVGYSLYHSFPNKNRVNNKHKELRFANPEQHSQNHPCSLPVLRTHHAVKISDTEMDLSTAPCETWWEQSHLPLI